jgi:hypothetical protein
MLEKCEGQKKYFGSLKRSQRLEDMFESQENEKKHVFKRYCFDCPNEAYPKMRDCPQYPMLVCVCVWGGDATKFSAPNMTKVCGCDSVCFPISPSHIDHIYIFKLVLHSRIYDDTSTKTILKIGLSMG